MLSSRLTQHIFVQLIYTALENTTHISILIRINISGQIKLVFALDGLKSN